jgi:predicted lactoylglutathione lyase
MTPEPKFTDETAACMVLSDAIHVMLLTHPKFSEFTPRPIADARAATQVLNTFTLESREAVDELAARALAAGATEIRDPEDHGFMYGRWIDETAVPAETQ